MKNKANQAEVEKKAQESILEMKAMEPEELKKEIYKAIQNINGNYVTLGISLNTLKEKNTELYRNTVEWITKNSCSAEKLCKCMRVAKEFEGDELFATSLGIRKSYALLSIKDREERKKFIKDNNINKNIIAPVIEDMINVYLNKNNTNKKENVKITDENKILKKLSKIIDKELGKINEFYVEAESLTNKQFEIKKKLEELKVLLEEDTQKNSSEDNKNQVDNNQSKQVEIEAGNNKVETKSILDYKGSLELESLPEEDYLNKLTSLK